jgi:mRNA-degrading endonuclease toxin of MazEF toxin-antitoxin module
MNGKVSTALLSQLRVFDTRRFINKIGVVDQKNFAEIKLKLIKFIS